MSSTTWNLADLYATEDDFEADLEKVKKILNEYAGLKGKLNTEENILKLYQLAEAQGMIVNKMFAFRLLKHDENLDDEVQDKKYQKMDGFIQWIYENTSFDDPEILANSEEFLKNMMEKEPRLRRYKNDIERLIKEKAHMLSAEAEEALSCFSRELDSFVEIRNQLVESDFEFRDAEDSDGKKHKVTIEKASVYMESEDRLFRKNVYESKIEQFKKYAHTLTSLYLQSVRANCADAKLRKYSSYFESCMESTKSTVNVYDELIKAVRESLPLVHRYYELRKKTMGYEKMYFYDMAVKLVPNVKKKYSYKEAKEMVLKAVAPLGKQYVQDLKRAFDSSWSDVYEKDNKISGAFSCNIYGVHPYVLQNFNGTYYDVSTTAHEYGHAMHAVYSNQSQLFFDCEPETAVSEVVSTVNEILLNEYLINNETDIRKKAGYLIEEIDNIIGSLIDQTMFAEFEKWVYELVSGEEELTCEEISEYYQSLKKDYYGESVYVDDLAQYGWLKVPHFYTPFYVYNYATGMAAAVYIVTNAIERGEEYSKKYIEMLHMGASISPLDELRHAEVDLETETPVKNVIEFLARRIDEAEKLMAEIKN